MTRFEAELLEYFRTRHGGAARRASRDPKADVPDELGDAVADVQGRRSSAAGGDAARRRSAATDADELGEAESDKTLATE